MTAELSKDPTISARLVMLRLPSNLRHQIFRECLSCYSIFTSLADFSLPFILLSLGRILAVIWALVIYLDPFGTRCLWAITIMLIQETHKDVPTKAGGQEGSMRE
jgi:hypothetical protein